MKKITSFASLLFFSMGAFAQNNAEAPRPIIDNDFMRELLTTSGVLIGLFLVSSFFLNLIRSFLDGKLKGRLIERGASEDVVNQLLQPLKTESKLEPLKWFSILAGIGLGLLLIDAFQPLGIHSLAIMAFSLAAGFLSYYLLTKKAEK